MAEGNKGPEIRPGASLEDILRMQRENAERKQNRDNPAHGTVIHGHVNLDQADAEARARRRQHPTSGSTESIPDRWTSTGSKPPKPEA